MRNWLLILGMVFLASTNAKANDYETQCENILHASHDSKFSVIGDSSESLVCGDSSKFTIVPVPEENTFSVKYGAPAPGVNECTPCLKIPLGCQCSAVDWSAL